MENLHWSGQCRMTIVLDTQITRHALSKLTRRTVLLGSGAALGFAGGRLSKQSLPSATGTTSIARTAVDGTLNDASGLSQTPIHKHIVIKDTAGSELADVIRTEMRDANAAGRPVNIGAARHSMGAQAIPRDGHAITFDAAQVEPDTTNKTYRVHAGTRWHNVIGALDPMGWSPAVMQSNNDFGVAATFCVNAHGWPVPFGPMGSTVRSIELLVPSGDVVTCSRTENADLFNLTMGGYGLTGAILSLDVDMVRNQRLDPTFEPMDAAAFAPAFTEALEDPNVTMAYGRLNVGRESFMQKALLITYRPNSDQTDLPAAAGSGAMSKIARHIYRAQLGRETAKTFRWWTETKLGPAVGSGSATRNSLINEPVATLDDRDPLRTDILHEYFVAPDRFDNFLALCRRVIPASYQSFLNVTLRYIKADTNSVLNFAPVHRIAAVMSFSQAMTERSEADMARMTQALIDGIVAIGGTYYLPYRPHARVDQFARAYTRASEFAKAKREIDPSLLFRNNLWDSYLEQL